MRIIAAAAFSIFILAGATGAADAKGCMKGAAVGGIAGHMVGHGVLGAAADCAVGHHEANKEQRADQAQRNDSANPPAAGGG